MHPRGRRRIPVAALLAALLAAGCGASEPEFPAAFRIAFALDRGGGDRDIHLLESAGGEPVRVAPDPAYDETPAFSADGFDLLFASERGGVVKGLYLWSEGRLDKACTAPYLDSAPCWSPDGRRIAVMSNRDQNWEIYTMSPKGIEDERLTFHPKQDTWPAWSPDGKSIAFVSDRGASEDLYVMDADGKNLRALTADRRWDGRPAWSPDGKRIAWSSERDGKAAVFVMNADGTGVRRLTPLDYESDDPCWSPDGRWIAFVSTKDGTRELYAMRGDGSGMRRLTALSAMVHTPAWGRVAGR